jgi:hypothetical protein
MVTDEHAAWSPLALAAVAALFQGLRVPWWIAGGWAIDIGVGAGGGAHADVDVQICRADQRVVQATLAAWELHAADPPGTLRPWLPGETLPAQVQDVWRRPAPTAPWALQLMLADTAGEDWIFRRDRRVRRPLTLLTRHTAEGLPYIAPEIQLLFKARPTPRPKDEHDFTVALPLLGDESRAWLTAALRTSCPAHPWLRRL